MAHALRRASLVGALLGICLALLSGQGASAGTRTGGQKPKPPVITIVAIGGSPEYQTLTLEGAGFGAAKGALTFKTPRGMPLPVTLMTWTPGKIVARVRTTKAALLRHPGTYTVSVTTAGNVTGSTAVSLVFVHKDPAESVAPAPDDRPYIMLAVAALLVGIGWLDLRRRQRRAS